MTFYLNSTERSGIILCVCVSISLWECLQEIDYTLIEKRSHNKWKEIIFRSKVFELYYICRNTPFWKLVTIAPFIECFLCGRQCLIHPRHYFYLIFLKILQGGYCYPAFIWGKQLILPLFIEQLLHARPCSRPLSWSLEM